MTKFLLHGGLLRKEGESNDKFYEELVKDIPDNGTLLICYFASRHDDNSNRIEYDKEKIQEKSQGKVISIVIATKEDFITQLKKTDAVYFDGGSTAQLLEVLRTYPDLKPLLVNKIVAGSSAGAYVLSTLYASHYKDRALEGLGIVPLRVVCHYESPEMPPDPGAVSALRDIAPELELVALKDCEWRMFSF